MLYSEPLVVSMPHSVFLAWLRSGVCWLPLAKFAPADEDICVKLPPKYTQLPPSGPLAAVLIDEVIAITQSTPVMTEELGIRLRNLGEAWLPVQYFPSTKQASGAVALEAVVTTATAFGTGVDAGCATSSESCPSRQLVAESLVPNEDEYSATGNSNPMTKTINKDPSAAEEDTLRAPTVEQSRPTKKSQARRATTAKKTKPAQAEYAANQSPLLTSLDNETNAVEAEA